MKRFFLSVLALAFIVTTQAQLTQSTTMSLSTNGVQNLLSGKYRIESITLINPDATNAVTIKLYDSANTTVSQSLTYPTVTQAIGNVTNVYTSYGLSITNVVTGLQTTVGTTTNTVYQPLIAQATSLPISGSVAMTGVDYQSVFGVTAALTGTNVTAQIILTYTPLY